MPDYAFKVEKVPMASRYVAARYLSLESLLGRKIPRRPSAAFMTASIRRARKKWHCFCDRMLRRKWVRINTHLKRQYLRNCPPAGVLVGVNATPCEMALACPNCYARRYGSQLFDALERALWPDPSCKEALPYHLIEFQGRGTQEAIDAFLLALKERDSKKSEWDRVEALQFVLGQHQELVQDSERRRREWCGAGALGGFVLHRIHYRAEGYPVLGRSGLLVVPRGRDADFGERNAFFRSRLHTKVTRGVLTRALARVCRFPAGWVREAAADEVLVYLKTFRRTRMLSTYGLLRGKGE